MTSDPCTVRPFGLPAAKSNLATLALPVGCAALLHRLHESWSAVSVEVPIGSALGRNDGAELDEVSGRPAEGLWASGRSHDGLMSVLHAVLLSVATSSG